MLSDDPVRNGAAKLHYFGPDQEETAQTVQTVQTLEVTISGNVEVLGSNHDVIVVDQEEVLSEITVEEECE